MTQPSFVPIAGSDQVRPARRLEAPRQWRADRPAEQRWPVRPGGPHRGQPGPDQGFALRLARRSEDRLHLVEGEHAEDVLVGCALVAARRAGIFGRAPSAPDLQVAFALWGFLDPSPAETLVAARRRLFPSAAHEYVVQRSLVDAVPEDLLRVAPGEVAGEVASRVAAGEWPAPAVVSGP